MRLGASAALWLALAAMPAVAQVPLQIHYQGYLASSAGAPVNTPRDLRFSLYQAQDATQPVWQEDHPAVPVTNGNFGVMLGSITPLDLAILDAARWLGVQVLVAGEAEMTPRQPLGTAPFAAIAQQAKTLASTATVQGSQIVGAITSAAVPGVAPWVAVTGTTQQALPNTAYLATGAIPATITLPAAPAVGDIVKVSAPNTGGWTLAVNAGQTIEGAVGGIWHPHESVRAWETIASSADGTKIVAAEYQGLLYTSADGGLTWSARGAERYWRSVTSSADGTKLVAVDFGDGLVGGHIYTSTDAGLSWTPRESARFWRSVASSADGSKLVAVVFGGQIYTSTDSGLNWIPSESVRNWQTVASSADGTKLVAAEYGGQIYTSIDAGLTWTPQETARDWISVASSADGTKLVAVVYGGQIYTSADSGVNWTPRENGTTWYSVASSADGTKLVAVVYNGQIYTSIDSGVTWAARESVRYWGGVASSADGTKLVALVYNGQIYTSAVTSLSGGPYASAELVYTGNGKWNVVRQQGTISAP
jgi:hypothetical protein